MPQNPLSVDASLLAKWSEFLFRVREIFYQEQFIEVTTPSLVRSSGTETHIQPFRVADRWFLPTSPEFAMKKWISQGVERQFEIKTCFRDEDTSPTHSPQFSLLEWYRVGGRMADLVQDVLKLVNTSCEMAGTGTPSYRRVRIAELFEQVGLELTPQTSRNELYNYCEQLDLGPSAEDRWDDLFWRIFLEKVESKFDPEELLIVSDFPPSMAAYAQIAECGWGQRFEVYWRGLELGNAYHEIISADEQLERWKNEQYESGELVEFDQQLLDCMRFQFPDSVGIALGLDRLFMAALGLKSIDQVPGQALFFQS